MGTTNHRSRTKNATLLAWRALPVLTLALLAMAVGSAWAEPGTASSGGGTVKAGAGLQKAGTTLSCRTAGVQQTGCVTDGEQAMRGPKSFQSDGGTTTYPVYVRKGGDLSAGGQAVGICFGGNPSPTGTTCSSADGRAATLTLNNDAVFHFSTGISGDAVANLNWAGPMNFGVAGYLRMQGVATGSLPTCSGLAYSVNADTTLGRVVQCTGGSWAKVGRGDLDFFRTTWTALCPSGVTSCQTEEGDFLGPFRSYGGDATDHRITCSWGTAGTGGSTGAVVEIRNTTDGSDVCSCTLGACTTAASVPTQCTCSGTITSGRVHTLRMSNVTDCTVNPQNVVCTIESQVGQ